ncbi:hypothetical protein [Acutalibacter muris]|jgi:hypothetical protein|uniref:hypothetical protein n=1 Tax=Acutalibacter muris TaxID=1796620 RepID=UPI0026F4053D|nr:hypothetical protein [Acutalibacter muris]
MINQTYEMDYRGMDGFSRFCSLIAEKSGQYRFIAARERRGWLYHFQQAGEASRGAAGVQVQ